MEISKGFGNKTLKSSLLLSKTDREGSEGDHEMVKAWLSSGGSPGRREQPWCRAQAGHN